MPPYALCDLWRRTPPNDPPCHCHDAPPPVFPSARRAIAQALIPGSRVGYPLYTSACVPRAIAFAATPVQRFDGDLDALLVHEPCGWPVDLDGLLGQTVVLDRVDSADFFLRRVDHPRITEVVSLSKTLGLLGGGLARLAGEFLPFRARPLTQLMTQLLVRAGAQHAELFKNSDQAVHPSVTAWIGNHCIREAMEHERLRRQANLRLVASSPLGDGWPTWMQRAIEQGAGPGLAPVLRHKAPARHAATMRLLAETFGITSTMSVFNWSGKPLEPDFGACLLLPVHGDMRHLGELLEALPSGPC